ncbi:hypothetical protein LINPERHAP1_LOCUS31593 [Linum perenne]
MASRLHPSTHTPPPPSSPTTPKPNPPPSNPLYHHRTLHPASANRRRPIPLFLQPRGSRVRTPLPQAYGVVEEDLPKVVIEEELPKVVGGGIGDLDQILDRHRSFPPWIPLSLSLFSGRYCFLRSLDPPPCGFEGWFGTVCFLPKNQS